MANDLLDSAPCGYIIFRDDGEVELINSTLLRWLGFRRDEVIGKNIGFIFTIPARIFYQTHFFPILKLHGKAEEIFLQLKTSGPENLPCLINAERQQEDGEFRNHCAILPVRQRKKFEEEILMAKRSAEKALEENRHLQELKATLEKNALTLETHLQKQLSTNRSFLQFSKVISHDLQEPIHKIQVFADRIRQTETFSLKGKSDLLKIDAAANRLRMLTRGLDHFISVDGEREIAEVDLNAVVDHAMQQVSKNYPHVDYELRANELPSITGNFSQLTLMLYHLVDNAFQFRNPSEKLTIRVTAISLDENLYQLSPNRYKYAEHVRITFSDNGVGFDMQYKEYVFDLLKKISPDTNRLGIGLGLIKKIVDNHRGTIKVYSTPNQGTDFIITLPRLTKELT